MARVTISHLQNQVAERDAEIARLNALLLQMREKLSDQAAALRLIGTIVQDNARS